MTAALMMLGMFDAHCFECGRSFNDPFSVSLVEKVERSSKDPDVCVECAKGAEDERASE